MGIIQLKYLDGPNDKIYACKKCNAHVALHSKIVSKNFTASTGKAYLIAGVVNIQLIGQAQDRVLRTGLHTVQDVQCIKCGTTIGWTYIKAFNQSEQYKVGKYVLERSLIKLISEENGLMINRYHGRSYIAASSNQQTQIGSNYRNNNDVSENDDHNDNDIDYEYIAENLVGSETINRRGAVRQADRVETVRRATMTSISQSADMLEEEDQDHDDQDEDGDSVDQEYNYDTVLQQLNGSVARSVDPVLALSPWHYRASFINHSNQIRLNNNADNNNAENQARSGNQQRRPQHRGTLEFLQSQLL
ncbi:hypothetical protein MP228_002643 [Amoeboaphelidium protococcarum]|nr:hypothetical protein MP228_002643 [Amoeboaphelidium protococcarum]